MIQWGQIVILFFLHKTPIHLQCNRHIRIESLSMKMFGSNELFVCVYICIYVCIYVLTHTRVLFICCVDYCQGSPTTATRQFLFHNKYIYFFFFVPSFLFYFVILTHSPFFFFRLTDRSFSDGLLWILSDVNMQHSLSIVTQKGRRILYTMSIYLRTNSMEVEV